MAAFDPDDLPVVFQGGGAEIRSSDIGGMTLTFYRVPAGADARALLEGLPGGSCQCPHWGYLIAGKLRIHTANGPLDVEAGQAFHVEPGHAPESLADTRMFEVSPVQESHEVWDYLAAR